jgi:lipoprotein-anchoring transpeptidase ErfK/SrfK
MPFIGSTYGLHALPEWPNGYREGENHLGIPVSHGCVRLSTAAAAQVYSWADVGTIVVIHR